MKLSVIGVALIALLIHVAGAHAALSTGPSLNASLLYYEPVPATPGSLITAYIQIANSGTEAKQVQVTFVDNGPFTVEGERVKSTPSIPANENFLVKYQVRVSKDASPGTNYIKIQYGMEGSGNTASTLLPIEITSSTVSLSIADVRMSPSVFVPGNPGNLTLRISNNADQKISSGKVTLDLTSVDITPLRTNQQWFTDLQAGETRDITFELAPTPSIAPGVYKIPVAINFTDQQGKTYSAGQTIGVRVGAEPDISVTIDDTKVTSDQKTGDVIIRVTNKGLGEVKFVDLVLGDSDTYDIVTGSHERYIGNIDSDDYKTARITIEAKKGDVVIPVTVTYMDALNTQYKRTVTLDMPVRSTQNGSNIGKYSIVALIIVGIVVYLVVRRRKAKK